MKKLIKNKWKNSPLRLRRLVIGLLMLTAFVSLLYSSNSTSASLTDRKNVSAVNLSPTFAELLRPPAITASFQGSACTPPPANLVSWYRAEGNANDQQGNNNGTLQNGAGFTVGKVGQTFNLDGANDYVDIGDLAQLDNTTELTVMAWVNRQNTGASDAGIIGKWNDTGATNNSFLLLLGGGGFAQNVGAFIIEFNDDSVGFLQDDTAIPLNNWTFLAATWRNSDGLLKLYKNGVEEGSTIAGVGRTMRAHRDYTAKIGEWGILHTPSSFKFPGQIDEAAVFNRALSAAEIQSIFNAQSAGMCLTGPLQISPTTASVAAGATQAFTATGGTPPYSFSILTNNSGASIGPASGVYTAGTTANVTDTVRVIDAASNFTDANVSVTPSAANRLAFIVQPSNTTAGQMITPPVQVVIQDQFGNTVGNASHAITITIQNNPAGGTLSGTLTRNASNGIATFNNLGIQTAGSGYTLQATTSGLTSGTSAAFNVSPASATKLAFITQPSNTNALVGMTPSVKVAIQDAFGNTVTNATDSIALTLENNPGNDLLFGTKMVTAVDGVATFNNLTSSVPANGNTLRAHVTGLTDAISSSYNIIRPLLMVTNTAHVGAGSLKQAIDDSNSITGTDTINFNIAGTAPFRIQQLVNLPEILGPIVLDATTQPGYAGTPIVELQGPGTNAVTGLQLLGGNSTIKGLAIHGFIQGISLRLQGGNTIQGNFIGVTPNPQFRLHNVVGISATSHGNQIGGTTSASKNVISGNIFGIELVTANSTVIKGNHIGTLSDGTTRLPNLVGILIGGNTSDCTIGGVAPGEANVIVSGERGIHFRFAPNAVRNSIRGNLLRNLSGLLFIDLDPDNRTPNDPGDADTGGNNRQNFPVITSATVDSGSTTVQGTLNSTPLSSFIVDLYSFENSVTVGTGSTYQGSINVATDSSGIGSFQVTLPGLPVNHFISATATDQQGNTSEFSDPKFVIPLTISITGRVLSNTGAPINNVRIDLTGGQTASTSTDSNGNYSFTVPGGLSFTVTPKLLNHDFSPAAGLVLSAVTNREVNFTGAKVRSTLIGIVNQLSNGVSMPVLGAVVTLNGPTPKMTIANGVFVFTDVFPGQYMLTIEKSGVVFSPSNSIISVSTTDQVLNFLGQPGSPLPGRLVFGVLSSNNLSNPFSMNADGTAYVQLAHQSVPPPNASVAFRSAAALSRDGKFLVGRNGPGQLSVSNADGSNHRSLSVNLGSNNAYDYSFSPDGTKIACVAAGDSIAIANTDGSGVTTLSLPDSLAFENSPTWLTNTRIAFSARDTASLAVRYHIYAVNIDSTNFTQLTSGLSDHLFPVASPDGSKIAFATSFGHGPLKTMNADGTGVVQISTNVLGHSRFAWSPDGTKLCFSKLRSSTPFSAYDFVAVNASNGGGLRVIINRELFAPSWGPLYQFSTATGSSVNVNSGFTSITFSGVTASGTTTITPIPLISANLPGGFQLAGTGFAFDISTTATFTPPIMVCMVVPMTVAPTQAVFDGILFMHRENGVFVNRTSSRQFATRTICGTVSSLSPFVLAEQKNANLPSIHGLVHDDSGTPLPGVSVRLTGSESRFKNTDPFGNFAFVNLTPGGSYNVQPKQPGYLFSEYSQDFVNLTGEKTVAFIGTPGTAQISGRVTDANGTGVNNITINLEGPVTSSVVTDVNGNYALANLPVDGGYRIVPELGVAAFTPADAHVDPLIGNAAGIDFQLTSAQPTPTPNPTPMPTSTIQFAATTFTVDEDDQNINVMLTRTGNTSVPSSVSFSMSDLAGSQLCDIVNGVASSRCDYESTTRTVVFAAGETSKSLPILVVDDAYLEGPETFTLTLMNPSGAALGSIAEATVSIADNEIAPGENPITTASFFVRQHYLDFFTRTPDVPGLAFWINEITSCGSDPQCVEVKRINVSAAFYLSIEFQETGYLVERLYKAAYGDALATSALGGVHQLAVPVIRLDEFLADTQEIGSGVIIGQVGWEQALENNKVKFIDNFVQRSRFTSALSPTLTAAQFVDQLNANAGNPLSQQERDQLVNELANGTKTRAQVLRVVAEDGDLHRAEFNRAFVLMQYFGYLRRNPNDAPDSDHTGYDFWLTKLNEFNGHFINAEMVKAFITSIEYRRRFGP